MFKAAAVRLVAIRSRPSDPLIETNAPNRTGILEIYSLLRQHAPEHAGGSQVDDLVHEIVSGVLEKLRNGTWSYPDTIDQAFIRTLLKNHVKNQHKKRRRGEAHDAEHLRTCELTHPSWMLNGGSRDDEWVAALENDVLAKLPYRCRMAYRMIRHENATYREAAIRLLRSPHTVHNYIMAAQRAFRQALQALETVDTLSTAEAPPDRAGRKRKHARFAPHYPAPAPVTTAR